MEENDQLTFKLADSNDIWLHTKDIHGSHVILKTKGSEPSHEDIREAALLAQVGHPTLDGFRIASGQLEELALEVRRHQDIHRRRGRLHERAVGNVVYARVYKISQKPVNRSINSIFVSYFGGL